MLNIANLYRIKISIWIRQLCTPGARGVLIVVAIMIINLIALIAFKLFLYGITKNASKQSVAVLKGSKRTFIQPVRVS